MKKLIFMFFVTAFTVSAGAVNKNNISDGMNVTFTNDDVIDKPDVLPEFPGGMDALFEFIRTNVKYPAEALSKKIEGKVIVRFVVNKDGSIGRFKVISKTPEILNKEALRVVRSMPKWKAGKKDGKVVNVEFVLPVAFKLQ